MPELEKYRTYAGNDEGHYVVYPTREEYQAEVDRCIIRNKEENLVRISYNGTSVLDPNGNVVSWDHFWTVYKSRRERSSLNRRRSRR